MSSLNPFYRYGILLSILNPGRIHKKLQIKVILQVSCSCDFTARAMPSATLK